MPERHLEHFSLDGVSTVFRKRPYLRRGMNGCDTRRYSMIALFEEQNHFFLLNHGISVTLRGTRSVEPFRPSEDFEDLTVFLALETFSETFLAAAFDFVAAFFEVDFAADIRFENVSFSYVHNVEVLKSINLHIESGKMIAIVGATGSGKSTTLAALMDYINQNFSRHIITVEEPIEFVHNNKKSIITQREVPIQTPTFADGLRAALREDADIVLVGEMRDLETISLALTAAETGLLVFGTLHTNNARKTVDRLIDVFPADQQSQIRTMLAASLKGVVAQLLCRRDDKPGRVAVNEIMVSNSAVAAIIREGATQKLYDVIIGGKAEGMQFMDEAIWEKLQAGVISPFEAYMKAIDKKRFKSYLPESLQELAHSSGGELEGAAAG